MAGTVGGLGAGNKFDEGAVIEVRGGEVDKSTKWQNAGAPYQQYGQPTPTPPPKPGPAASQEPGANSPIAQGTPGGMPIPPPQPANGAAPPSQGQGRTLIGAAAPPGLANYAQGYPSPYGQPTPGRHRSAAIVCLSLPVPTRKLVPRIHRGFQHRRIAFDR